MLSSYYLELEEIIYQIKEALENKAALFLSSNWGWGEHCVGTRFCNEYE